MVLFLSFYLICMHIIICNKTAIWHCSLQYFEVLYIQLNVSCNRSLRCESIEATSLHLQQPILPVGSGDTEVMDGASQDAEGFCLQSELWRVGPQTLQTSHFSISRVIPEGQNTLHNWKRTCWTGETRPKTMWFIFLWKQACEWIPPLSSCTCSEIPSVISRWLSGSCCSGCASHILSLTVIWMLR